MVGVQDERGVERRRRPPATGSSPSSIHRKFAACGSFGLGGIDLLAGAQAVVVRDQGRGLRDQPHRLAVLGLGRVVPPVGVVGGGRRDRRAQHGHRRGLLRPASASAQQERRQLALVHQELVRARPAPPGSGSCAVVQQVDDLLERGVARRGRRCRSRRTRAVPARRRCRRSPSSAATTSRAPFRSRGHILRAWRPVGTRARVCQDSRRPVHGPGSRADPQEGTALTHRITLIPGDGIGPEVVEAARRVIEATGSRSTGTSSQMGPAAVLRATGRRCRRRPSTSIRATRVALKGPVETPVTSGLAQHEPGAAAGRSICTPTSARAGCTRACRACTTRST